jgi:hypothetical protein
LNAVAAVSPPDPAFAERFPQGDPLAAMLL